MPPHASDGRPQTQSSARARRSWVAPVVVDLPRLTDLTLTTGAPIPGGGSGGSTVVP